MNDYFNNSNIHSAYDLIRVREEQEKEQRQKELEKQKKEKYDNKVFEVAEQTRDIEKQNLNVSKNSFKIAVTALIVAGFGVILSLIALFKS